MATKLIMNSEKRTWFKNNKIHRDKLKPAVEYFDGELEYFSFGSKFFVDKTQYSTSTFFIQRGFVQGGQAVLKMTALLHSFGDLPSVFYKNGTKEWHFDGKLHRIDGPAVVYSNLDEEWWYLGKRHRIDGPAVTIGNKQCWFEEGEFQKCIV
ncbi:MAG: hypothetical protein EKK64_06665 [Neisseriaceae bacterium]|nr:MAG: hypothetical protein EKK64_06665 [Neisseriaceae bacterium]